MPLKSRMTPNEIREYLEGDLTQSINNDVWPIVQPDRPEGGYFGVTRSVLCYVNFLGALYRGYGGKKDKRTGRKVIATTKDAEAYLRHIMGAVDPSYKRAGSLLYEMYRHGTVHAYQPKELERDGRILTWMPYKGSRTWAPGQPGYPPTVTHLRPVPHPSRSSVDCLPVSIVCLVEDLQASLTVLFERIEQSMDLVTRWNSAARAFLEPDPVRRRWW